MKGQYGPYIKYKSLNATIPEEKDPTELTMEEALILIEKRKEYDKNKKKKKQMNPENILKENNIILPEAADPVGSYVAAKIIDKLLYISGQISIGSDGKLIKGKLGKDLAVEDGYKAAERLSLIHISEPTRLLSISYAVFCLKKKT